MMLYKRAESREQRAESREQGEESREQRGAYMEGSLICCLSAFACTISDYLPCPTGLLRGSAGLHVLVHFKR
jgi:hypothetical protein